MVSAGPPPGDIRQQIQDFLCNPPAAGVGKPAGLDRLPEAGDGLIDRAKFFGHYFLTYAYHNRRNFLMFMRRMSVSF
jgi:hypothetical protein